MNQSKCDPRVRSMKNTALPFNQIPMIRIVVRSQPFHGARHKIGNNRIQGNTTAGDKNTGLP